MTVVDLRHAPARELTAEIYVYCEHDGEHTLAWMQSAPVINGDDVILSTAAGDLVKKGGDMVHYSTVEDLRKFSREQQP